MTSIPRFGNNYYNYVHSFIMRINLITSLVHASSLVCAVECSARERVDMPSIFLLLKIYNKTDRDTSHLSDRQGTVVWYAALAVESCRASVITHLV